MIPATKEPVLPDYMFVHGHVTPKGYIYLDKYSVAPINGKPAKGFTTGEYVLLTESIKCAINKLPIAERDKQISEVNKLKAEIKKKEVCLNLFIAALEQIPLNKEQRNQFSKTIEVFRRNENV